MFLVTALGPQFFNKAARGDHTSHTLFFSSFLSALLLMDFHTPHLYTYDCFLIGARTTSGTHKD